MPTPEEVQKAKDEAAAIKAAEEAAVAKIKEDAAAKIKADADAAAAKAAADIVPDSQKDMKALIEKVRKEEKDKLYPRIEKAEKEAAAEKATREAQEKRIKELEDKMKAADDEDVKKKKTIEEKLAEMDKTYRDELQVMKAAMEKEKQDLTARLERERLDVVRAREIGKYKGDIIDEMVSGNSETEIAASALAAHERYKTIAKDASDKLIQRTGTPSPANPDVPAGGGGTDLSEAASNLRNPVNPYGVGEEFAKKRHELRSALNVKFSKRGG